jgi:hypothetical protein
MRAKTPATLVCGPPGSGKSTYVKNNKGPDDLVIDVDEMFRALSLSALHEKPECLLPFVLAARDAVLALLARGFLGPPHAWVVMCGENNEARAELAASLGAAVVVLPVPVGECRRRMTSQGRPDWHIREMVDVGVRWHREFRARNGEVVSSECMRPVGADGWPVG